MFRTFLVLSLILGAAAVCDESWGPLRCDLPTAEQQVNWSEDSATYFNVNTSTGCGVAQPRRIIVVGAGMAGLSAARLLHSVGHTVTIYEKEGEVWGRIKTVTHAPDQWVETGAMRIPDTHNTTMNLIKQAGLWDNLEPFPSNNSRDDDIFYVNGKQFNLTLVKADLSILNEALNVNVSGTLKALSDPVLQEFENMNLTERVEAWPKWWAAELSHSHKSLDSHLRSLNYSRDQRAVLGLLDGYSWYSSEVNLMEAVRDQLVINPNTNFNGIHGGNHQLPAALANSLWDNLRLNHEVTGVTETGDGVLVEGKYPGGFFQQPADFVLVTAPMSRWNWIDFRNDEHPKRFDLHLHVSRQLHHDSAIKVYLWFREGVEFGHLAGKSITTWPSREIYYFPRKGGIFAMAYLWAEHARRLMDEPDAELVKQLLDDLAQLWSADVRRFAYTKRSGVQRYNNGFVLSHPCGVVELQVPVASAQCNLAGSNRTYFAGEAMHPLYHAWIESAVQSGQWAACQINRRTEAKVCEV